MFLTLKGKFKAVYTLKSCFGQIAVSSLFPDCLTIILETFDTFVHIFNFIYNINHNHAIYNAKYINAYIPVYYFILKNYVKLECFLLYNS